MDRVGCGLALDNNSNQIDHLFGSKSVYGFNLSMDHRSKGLSMFPASSDHGDAPAPPARRAVLSEVDFFAEKKNPIVKKEYSSPPEASNLDNVNIGLQLVSSATNARSDQSAVDDGAVYDQEDKRVKQEKAQLQFELERMIAENQRLKGMLAQVTHNYSTLQMHLATMQQQQQSPRITKEKKPEINGKIVPRPFLDLVPGGATEEQSNSSSEERTLSGSPHMELSRNKKIGREESPESAGWASNKAAKLNSDQSAAAAAAEATMRKARVSVRARSEAPIISDGCQWRKYGQKMAKGNPCPRAYYRCTMAVGCPVRKQVQRCADDRTVLITTYEGTHSHPLPPTAVAMASTTTSAANMLLSGSMPSADGGLMNHPNFLGRSILPCSTNMATISASAPFPTVTLDLTQTPNSLPPQSHRFPAAMPFQQQNPIPGAPNQSAVISQVFGQALYNQSRFSGVQMSSNDAAKPESGPEPSSSPNNPPPPPPLMTDTLTAVIAADPNFTAALAAAISSIIGAGPAHQANNSSQSTANNHHSLNTSDDHTNKTNSSPRN